MFLKDLSIFKMPSDVEVKIETNFETGRFLQIY